MEKEEMTFLCGSACIKRKIMFFIVTGVKKLQKVAGQDRPAGCVSAAWNMLLRLAWPEKNGAFPTAPQKRKTRR
ncbi:hypothetical protein [Butyricicoccus sp.]|uniref:hypothetical protein n=1 Tax=Butyricicoccus sp. TaxID=2049021 RepID=UPI003F188208